MTKRQKIRKGLLLFMFFIFPATFYYFSPVIAVHGAIAGVLNGSMIMFLLMFVSALFLGRGFCGWACPGGGCQETVFMAREKKVTRGNYIKWLIWTPWIGTIMYLVFQRGGYERVDFFYETVLGLSISDLHSFIIYMIVLLLLLVFPAYVFGKRSFCHHLCWMAPFLILGRAFRNMIQWPSLGLMAESDKCVHCRACSENCPMSLSVMEMVRDHQLENTECILCCSCIDACKTKVIKIGFIT